MNKIIFITEIKANIQFCNLYFFLIDIFIKLEIKDDIRGWRCGSVARCLTRICTALVSMPSAGKKAKEVDEFVERSLAVACMASMW